MKRFVMALLPLLTFIVCTANAKDNYEWKTASAAGYTYKYVSNDPMQARYYTLKNGLTVILSPSKKEPRMQVYIAVKAGSKTDPADHTGLAHYLEHMMFKGTQHYGSMNWAKEKPLLNIIDGLYEEYNHTTDEVKRKEIYHRIDSVSGVASKYAIANEYDKMMTNMGAQGTNAFTSYEQTVYTEDIPANAVDKFLKVQSDRFSDPVFRIFHTELEAVYEEKNRGLDNDDWKVDEALMSGLFLNHNYGKQTTIGTIEHLKNPSLMEIKKYFHTYYVPNNMGVIVAGDFDPDVMIKKIDKSFAGLKAKDVPKYTFEQEVPITKHVKKDVYGPNAEFVTLGFRMPGVHEKDQLLADLVGQMLTNGKAGLIDLDLVKKQKLLRAYAYTNILVDHGYMELQGWPTMGQKLGNVKNLMLDEIDKLKAGDFDNDLLVSIVNNQKKYKMMQTESYGYRAYLLMAGFTGEEDWRDDVDYIDRLSSVTKKDVVDFANKYFGDENYVVIYKHKGEDKDVIKVDKPPITPIQTNPTARSPFVKQVAAMPVKALKPVWLDYDKDIQKGKLGNAQVLYVQNKENGLFRLSYRYDMGTWNSKKLAVAAQYLQYLGTADKSAEQITREFYKLACSFNVYTSNEYTTVLIEGLQENFDQAVALFEDLMAHCKADEPALTALKARIMKSRSDNKSNKGAIMQAMVNYARYGEHNPYNNVMPNDKLNALTGKDLVSILHHMNDYEHKVIYYGPAGMQELTASLGKLHKMPESFRQPHAAKVFTFTKQDENKVLFTDYDMVQSEIRWVRNIPGYDPGKRAVIDMFNNYFGGGMGAVVFQTIRESKALAYSTYAWYIEPEKKEDPYYITAYVGCQADKFNESIGAMNELLNKLPKLDNNFAVARAQLKKDIETERVTKDEIIYNYLGAQRKGLDHDIRKSVYESADKLSYNDLKKFHTDNMSDKAYTYCVVASEKKVKEEDMKKYGKLQKVSLEELFGY